MADQRESLEVDVLIVGAGPGGLACAYHLSQLLKKSNRKAQIAIVEKAPVLGAHILSGAVIDPKGLFELIPELATNVGTRHASPLQTPVSGDEFWFMTDRKKWNLPIPPPLHNKGNYIISLSQLVQWLGPLVQKEGVDLFLGFPGQELLYDGDRVTGVRMGDKGIDKYGQPKPNFQPGIDLKTKVTILAEGVRGSLTKTLVDHLHLDEGKNPQTYSTGIKEIWKIRPEKFKKGLVIHTLGYPLSSHTFGGGFIYHYGENLVSIGFVTGLSYSCPHIDPHKVFQKYKKHPAITSMLEGGTMQNYGAKAIPEGGYFSMPRYWGDGFMIVGDNASFLNSQRLKGIHLAMKSGMLAAETTFEALQANDFSAKMLRRFEERVEQSWIKKELWRVRNFHQAFEHGLWYGLFDTALQMVTNGRGMVARRACKADHEQYRKLTKKPDELVPTAELAFQGDDKLTFTKTTDVFHSGTQHEENQPCHLVVADTNICHTRCREEYGNPCQHFCPANVYEMVEDPKLGLHLQINAANCVHCKTCDIKDPYGIITWVPPEGSGGPSYLEM